MQRLPCGATCFIALWGNLYIALRGNLGGALCGNLTFALCGNLFAKPESYPETVGNGLIPGDNVPEFRDLNMSRTSLYRKLKTLTGQSATEFIRHARLRKALGLMENGNFSIEEVSLSVGFNSHSYFSHCFRQHFGKTPSEFLLDKK